MSLETPLKAPDASEEAVSKGEERTGISLLSGVEGLIIQKIGDLAVLI
jgi:hypothetical protein